MSIAELEIWWGRPWWDFVGFCLVVGCIVAVIVLRKRFGTVYHARHERTVGEVRAFSVELLRDERGRRMVGVCTTRRMDGNEYVARCCLTGAQARAVAEWLRIAVSPGANLAQARFNRRRLRRQEA